MFAVPPACVSMLRILSGPSYVAPSNDTQGIPFSIQDVIRVAWAACCAACFRHTKYQSFAPPDADGHESDHSPSLMCPSLIPVPTPPRSYSYQTLPHMSSSSYAGICNCSFTGLRNAVPRVQQTRRCHQSEQKQDPRWWYKTRKRLRGTWRTTIYATTNMYKNITSTDAQPSSLLLFSQRIPPRIFPSPCQGQSKKKAACGEAQTCDPYPMNTGVGSRVALGNIEVPTSSTLVTRPSTWPSLTLAVVLSTTFLTGKVPFEALSLAPLPSYASQ